MIQQEMRYPTQEATLDTTASARPPDIVAPEKAAQTARTAASPNTATSMANLDRSQAVKGQVRPDKFTIELGPPDHDTFRKWRFPRHKEKNFDWQNMKHISSLNRWRSQIFRYVGRALELRTMIQELTVTCRRMVEISKRGIVPYHKDELDWLTEQFVLHKQSALEHGLEPNYHKMNWDSIAKAYNERFEGKMLPNCEDPRPNRTKASLQTQRYRIEAVCRLTGIPKKEPVRRVRKKQAKPATSGKSTKVKSRTIG